ncbi:MAG: glycosyltransferase family 4 protein [Rhodospirillales bacterium]|nr:glycosyltransferase family 4 protein [Rhodospirillales bacterium]
MNILFFSENFPPETNAAATRVYERAVYWARWGHNVTVITCAPNFPHGKLFEGYANAWYQTEIMSGIKVVRVKTYIAANQGVIRRSLDFISFLITGSVAGLLQPRPDIIAGTSPQFFAVVATWLVAGLKRKPFVFELGDLWPYSLSAVGVLKKGVLLTLFEKFELFLYRQSVAVAALTSAFKTNLVDRGIPASKIHVVVNGVDLDRYEPRERNQELAHKWGLTEQFVVGYIGTHGMAHGLVNVLDAAELLADRSDIVFLFVGAGAEREGLAAESLRRGQKNVIFIPAQPKERMPDVWSLCDVALVHLSDSPAFSDVLPSKIFEAMAMGLPVLLVSPEGEASKLVQKHNAGLWIPAGAPGSLSDVVRSLSQDEQQCVSFATSSLAAAPEYSRELQARKMLDVFRWGVE